MMMASVLFALSVAAQSSFAQQACFRPTSSYVATSTGEVISTAVVGNHLVALRYGRHLPPNVNLLHTDFGNWTIAVGHIGCRNVTMLEGFRGFGKVDEDGVIDWADPMDEWQPHTTWSEWLYSFSFFGRSSIGVANDEGEYELDEMEPSPAPTMQGSYEYE